MKILHTADWHVGKVLKGRGRHDEHRAVLWGWWAWPAGKTSTWCWSRATFRHLRAHARVSRVWSSTR